MKKFLLPIYSFLVCLFFAQVAFAQTTVCTKSAECFDFKYYGPAVNANGSVTLKFNVKVNCNHDLSHASFELPAGAKASTYSPNNGVENGTNNPFYSVKFETGSGTKNGASKDFTYTITAAQFATMTTVRAEAKASTTVGIVTFDAKGCGATPPPATGDGSTGGNTGGGNTGGNNGGGSTGGNGGGSTGGNGGGSTGGNNGGGGSTGGNGGQNCSTSQPRPITGEQHPCPGDIETYCIENDRGYTSFVWDVPRAHAGEPPIGWEIISGQGTNCVTVRVGLKSGTMKVKVTDPICGTKVATLPVKPGKPFEVTITGPDTVCTDEEQTYVATVMKRNGNGNGNGNNNAEYAFVWTVPADWTIVSGQGTTKLTVIPGVENGEVNVYVTTEEGTTGKGNNGNGVGGIKANCGAASDSKPVFIGDECGSLTPLPVELISFDGEATKAGVLLNWATASEKDNDRFEVERSADGKAFAVVGSVKGKGTTQAKQTYSMRDTKAMNGTQYYRLKQVDLDGKFEYSKVIAVENGQITTEAKVVVAPNPVSGGQFTVALNSSDAAQLQIMDMNGRMVYNQTVAQGTREVSLNTQNLNLKSGMYIINVKSNNSASNAKFIVR